MVAKKYISGLLIGSACAFMMFCLAGESARAESMPGVIGFLMGDDEEDAECCTYLGVFMEELTPRLKEKAGYTHETGVLISNVAPEGPAAEAGIEGGDICYLFDGVKVEDTSHLAKLVQERKAGDKVPVVIFRDGKEKRIHVTLGHRKSLPSIKGLLDTYSVVDLNAKLMDAYKRAGKLPMRYFMGPHLGMTLVDLNDDIASYFGVKKGEGVLVFSVEEDSPAAEAGIKGGDVIASVNGAAVEAVDDLVEDFAELEKGETVSLVVLRKGVKKSYELEADEPLGTSGLFIAPFEPSTIKIKKSSPAWVQVEGDEKEALKLKQEMKALKERLKDLEERLGSIEKSEKKQ